MTDVASELQQRLAALSQRFNRLSGDLAEAGRLLVEQRALPSESVFEEVVAVRDEFDDLRRRAQALAGALSVPSGEVAGLADLSALLQAIVRTSAAPAVATTADGRGAVEDDARRVVAEARRKAAEEEARPKAEEEAKRKAAEEARRKAEEEAKRKAEEEARRKAAEEEAKRKAAEEEARRKAAEEAKRKAEEEARRKAAEEEARRKAAEEARLKAEEEAKRKAEEEVRRKAEEARRKVEEIKRRTQQETPAAAGEETEELALETAQWWISATASWGNLRSRRVPFPDAIRDVLAKYPYVFSVPIQTSADYEDGLLAYGFAVLLEHVEQRAAGFVADALSRLPARKDVPVGRRLYDYLAQAVRGTYGDFIKAVLRAGLPKTPPWVNGGVEDTDVATTVFQRASARIGDPNRKGERFTQDRQRFADHQFTIAVAPLTARFFSVEATEVKEPRDVEIRLGEKGVPSDQAWLATAQREGAPQVRRQERQGSTITGLGRDCQTLWVALFNSDPDTEKRFELTLGLRRRGQAGATPFRRPR